MESVTSSTAVATAVRANDITLFAWLELSKSKRVVTIVFMRISPARSKRQNEPRKRLDDRRLISPFPRNVALARHRVAMKMHPPSAYINFNKEEAIMRVVINGKRYDTSSAILIGEAGYCGPKADLEWWEAGLYKTPRAERYFIAGAGNAMTRWGQRTDNKGRIGGFGIFPMQREEALEWAERYLTAEQVTTGFTVVMQAA
jgi:hypothetical protein